MFEAPDDPKRHAAAEALDKIRSKYGSRAVTRARLVCSHVPEPFERDPMKAVHVADEDPDSRRIQRIRDTEAVTDADEDPFTDA
ncbi:MAG: hypothetical protein U0838_15385 [Chloroflexota bacterium]